MKLLLAGNCNRLSLIVCYDKCCRRLPCLLETICTSIIKYETNNNIMTSTLHSEKWLQDVGHTHLNTTRLLKSLMYTQKTCKRHVRVSRKTYDLRVDSHSFWFRLDTEQEDMTENVSTKRHHTLSDSDARKCGKSKENFWKSHWYEGSVKALKVYIQRLTCLQ